MKKGHEILSMSKGFTLIELLVVVSIISLLSSVVLASINTARVKARDTQRKSDLHQLSVALELYFHTNGFYPATFGGTSATPASGDYESSTKVWTYLPVLVPTFISKLPKDPIDIDNGPYPWQTVPKDKNTIYTYISNGSKYVLCAWFENTSDGARLGSTDVIDPYNTALKLYANDGYSQYAYCLTNPL